MDVTITINCDNAAFAEGNAAEEVGRILRQASQKLLSNGRICDFPLFDINGNKVGTLEVEGSEEE